MKLLIALALAAAPSALALAPYVPTPWQQYSSYIAHIMRAAELELG